MSELHKAIQKARPKLKDIAPLTDAIIKAFGVFNILLGLSLLQLYNIEQSPTLAIVNSFFSFYVWGAIFIVLGVVKLWAVRRNNWELLRKMLVTAVLIKSVWFCALVLQIISGHGTYAVTILWSLLTVIQIYTYIYFAPTYYIKNRKSASGISQ